MKNILVMGLDLPLFAKQEHWLFNPAAKVAMMLDGQSISNQYTIMGGRLPWGDRFHDLRQSIYQQIDQAQPAFVIILGPHNKTDKIMIERTATNEQEQIFVDINPRHCLITNSPSALSTTLPIDEINRQLSESGYLTTTSDDCHKQSCNAAFYLLLHRLRGTMIPGCFCHIPHMPGMRKGEIDSSMPFDVLYDALKRLIEVTCTQMNADSI